MNPQLFREYDIRGIVGTDLNEEVVETIGRAFGTRCVREGHARIAVGRDTRLSSPAFSEALCRGVASTGVCVVNVGMLPTPLLYFAVIDGPLDGGVMITGSHNPCEYNGLKFCAGGLSLYGDEITELRTLCEAGRFAEGSGSVEEIAIERSYLADVAMRFKKQTPRKIVIDCGNGVGGLIAPELFRAVGHEVIELFTEPDGTFPNHLPDPEVPAYMQDLMRTVLETGADVGFGFDGDADRLGVIDETGAKISADWLLAVFARDLLQRHPGGIVRYDVKCMDFLEEDILAHGGVPEMGRTGHSILKRDIKELNAIIGGELSGHICYGREYYTIDDPFYCALKVLELMESTASCRGLFDGFPEIFATAEIKAPVPEQDKFRVVAELVESFRATHDVIDVDGVRVRFEDGWGLVRASNTTANLTVRFEAKSLDGVERIRGVFLKHLSMHPSIDLCEVRTAGVA